MSEANRITRRDRMVSGGSKGQQIVRNFGAILRAARRSEEASQTEIVTALASNGEHAISISVLSKIETGKRPVTLAEAIDIAEAMGMTLVDLVPNLAVLGGAGETTPAESRLRASVRAMVRDELVQLVAAGRELE